MDFERLWPAFKSTHHSCCNGSAELSKGTGNINCEKVYKDEKTIGCCRFYQSADFGEDDDCWPSKVAFSLLRDDAFAVHFCLCSAAIS